MSKDAGLLDTFLTFGSLLKYLRVRAKLTQHDLSIAVGYSEAQISRQESNKRVPSEYVLKALFVPALGLEDEPGIISRLLILAEKAREKEHSWIVSSPEESNLEPAAAQQPQNNLPAEMTSLIGREADLAEIARLLAQPSTRLLTLTGTGGCGKSRLGLRSGRNLDRQFSHGAWWVDLVPLSDPLMVPQVVVSDLGLASSPNHSPVDILTGFLRERELLLILDNCEHLVEAVARLAADLLSTCPGLKILATSREPLGAPGEILYRVPALALPPNDNSPSIESYAAARLFLERAASVQPGFTLGEGEGQVLARICRRMDGIPLAIELAAARMNVLSLQQLSDRLQEGFRVLGRGEQSFIPRHATLRAAVEWSYNLLPEPERMVLRRLPLFAGSWTLEQAEEICTANELEQEEVLEKLSALVSKSLVMTERLPDGAAANRRMRFRLHEMVRQYAHEKLVEAGEEETLHQRFLNCFICVAEQAEAGIKSLQQLECLASLDLDYANLVQALTLAVANQNALAALRLSGALDNYWQLRDLPLEAMRWQETALAMREADTANAASVGEDWLRARAKVMLSIIWNRDLSHLSPYDIQEIIRECEQTYQSLGDQNELMILHFATINFNDLSAITANIARSRARLPELLAVGDHRNAARLLNFLGFLERRIGNMTAGDHDRKEALIQARISGDVAYQAQIMQWLAWAEWDLGNIRQGLELLHQTTHIYEKVGHPSLLAKTLQFQAAFDFALGNYEQAYTAMNEAIANCEARGAYWRIWDIQQDLSLLYFFEGRLAEAREAIENEKVIKFVDEHPNTYGTGMYLEYLGRILLYEGQVNRAAELLAKCFEIPGRMNEHADMHQVMRTMGQVRLAQDNLPAAHELLHQTLAEITHNRTLPDFPETLDVLAQLTLAEGQPAQAARLLGASDGLLKRMEMVRFPVFRSEYERCRESSCSALGEAHFATAYAAGEAIAVDQNPIEAIQSLF